MSATIAEEKRFDVGLSEVPSRRALIFIGVKRRAPALRIKARILPAKDSGRISCLFATEIPPSGKQRPAV